MTEQAIVEQNAAVQTREAIAVQIAEMKAKQAAQREAIKAQRDEALAKLKAQREELKVQREASRAELQKQREAMKLKKDAESVTKAEAKLIAEQAKLEARAKKDAERLEREKAKLEAMENRVNSELNEQNGIREPGAETLSGRIWALFNDMSLEKGSPVSMTEVFQNTAVFEFNESTVRTQYARWKQFHGIVGRVGNKQTEPANQEGQQAA